MEFAGADPQMGSTVYIEKGSDLLPEPEVFRTGGEWL